MENLRNDHNSQFRIRSDELDALDMLVVEDDVDVASLIQMSVRAWGLPLNVRFCSDGYTAIRKMMSDKPDILLLDLRLPEIDGYSIMNAVRDSGETFPIMIISGLSENDVETLGGLRENVSFVRKPIDLQHFRKTLLEYIGLFQMAADDGVRGLHH